MKKFLFWRAVCACIIVSAFAGAQVSTASVTVGGPGAVGCQSALIPPTLTNGVPASAILDFTFDSSTDVLQLVVTNTSPIVGTDANPVITRMHFNLPDQAISSMTLLSQTGSGGATPNFAFAFDTDLFDSNNWLSANCFGDFGAQLSVGGASGGIANPAASNVGGPAGASVTGPVTFTFSVTRANFSNISAQSFARGFSVNGTPSNAGIKFQGGGAIGDESGVIGSAGSCEPSLHVIGEPRIGNTVKVIRAGYPGCFGCIVLSDNPGPTVVGPVSYPIGTPIYVLTTGTIPVGSVVEFSFDIPNLVSLVGNTYYLIEVLFPPGGGHGEVSDQVQVTVLP